jgi:4-carboxymuconolactone decarboxylase
MSPAVPLLDLDAGQRAQLDSVGAGTSNLYRALANHPVLLRAWVDFAWTLRSQAQTPRALRELMILRCAQHAGSRYVWGDHLAMAREAGIDQPRIDALDDWRSFDGYDDSERAVLALVDEVVVGAVTDETIDDLRARFSPASIVELVLTASFYVMVPRVVDGLRVPPQEVVA